MAWGWLQSFSGQNTNIGISTVTATPAANLTAGSTLIAVVSLSTGTGKTFSTLKDAALNTFWQIATSGAHNSTETAIYALNTPAGDAGAKPVFTLTMTGGAVMDLVIAEFSGIVTGATLAALVDGTPGTTFGSSNTATGSPTYSSTAANELLIAAYGDDGGPLTWTVPTGYTNDNNGGTAKGFNTDSNCGCELAFKNSTNGSETSSWGLSGTATGWGIVTCAFKVTGGGVVAGSPSGLIQSRPFQVGWTGGVPGLFLPTLTFGDETFTAVSDAFSAGVTAALVFAAPAGQVDVTLPGVTAALVFAAPTGTVSVGLPGAVAAAVWAAPAGSVSVTLPGAVAAAVWAASVGAVASQLDSPALPATAAAFRSQPGAPFQPVVSFGDQTLPPATAGAAGVTAALVFTAPAGQVDVTLSGVTAAAVWAAPAGTVSVSALGATATAVWAAPAGTVSVTAPGAAAAALWAAPTGQVDITLPGVVAAAVWAAPAGTVASTPDSPALPVLAGAFQTLQGPAFAPTLTLGDMTIPAAGGTALGVTATLVFSAPTGAVSVTLPGVVAAAVWAAPAASVSVTLPGTTAAIVFAASAGSVSVTLPGVTAAAVWAAPAGTVSVTLPGAVAAAVWAAPTGTVSVGLPGLTAATVFTAPPGVISVTLPGVTAAAVWAAPAGFAGPGVALPGVTAGLVLAAVPGTVSVTVLGVTAALTLTARTGTVSVTLPGVTAALVFGAPAGIQSAPPVYLTAGSKPTAGLTGGSSTTATLTAGTQRTGGPS